MLLKDLNFEPHPNWPDGSHVKVFFNNGYGASIVSGSHAYTSKGSPYELAVLVGNKDEFRLTYDTPITDDVLGHLDPNGVEALLSDIEALPPIEIGTVAY